MKIVRSHLTVWKGFVALDLVITPEREEFLDVRSIS